MRADGVACVDDLRRALSEGAALRLAIVFGSAAEDRARPDSDVDVGILPCDPDLPLHAELELQARLEVACGRPVDLVRLDRASTLLKWEVARRGVLIFGRSRLEYVRFVASAALEYAELSPNLSRAGALFRQRLIERRPGSGIT
jgi:predicted nucleotidyltransferase